MSLPGCPDRHPGCCAENATQCYRNHDQSDSNDGRLCVLVCWSCKAILIVTVIVIVVVIVIVIVKMILREAVLVCWSCKAMRFSDGRRQQ